MVKEPPVPVTFSDNVYIWFAWLRRSLTLFRVSGGAAVGGGDPRQTVGPVEGAGAGGQCGARVGWGGGSADRGNGRGGGGGRGPVTLEGRETTGKSDGRVEYSRCERRSVQYLFEAAVL